MKTYVFDEKTKDFILGLFKKEIDSSGYIVEKEDNTKVLTPKGNFVRSEDFAGITPGSEIILTKDLPSLLEYANEDGTHEF